MKPRHDIARPPQHLLPWVAGVCFLALGIFAGLHFSGTPGTGTLQPAAAPAGPQDQAHPRSRTDPPSAAPNVQPPPAPDALLDEAVLIFPDRASLNAFLARAGGTGILGVIEALHAVRVRLSELDEIDSGRQGFNHLVFAPDLPEGRAPDGTEYAAFGNDALRWLEFDAARAGEWGKGVLVALLDTMIDPASPAGRKLVASLDLLGASAGGEYSGHATAIATLLLGDAGAVPGVAPGAGLLGLTVLSGDGVGDSFTLAAGIVDAVNRGARVLSLSLGTANDSEVLRTAVEYALARNVVVVAAAGNDGLDSLAYPAAYPGVLSVTAVDASRQVPYFANRGEGLTIAAPGVGVQTLWDASSGMTFSGTSAAVPFVAGAVAGILSDAPHLTGGQVVQILLGATDDAGAPGPDSTYGVGILNLGRIQTRDDPGIFRLDIADHHLDLPGATAGSVPVIVTVQNRGTEPLQNISLSIVVGDNTLSAAVPHLAPGESAGHAVQIPRPQEPAAIPIRSSATSGDVLSGERSSILFLE